MGGGVPAALAPARRLLELDAVEWEEAGGAGGLGLVVELGQGELVATVVVESLRVEGASATAAFGVATAWLLVMGRFSGGHVATTVLLVMKSLLLSCSISIEMLLLIVNRLLMVITAASLMMT